MSECELRIQFNLWKGGDLYEEEYEYKACSGCNSGSVGVEYVFSFIGRG